MQEAAGGGAQPTQRNGHLQELRRQNPAAGTREIAGPNNGSLV